MASRKVRRPTLAVILALSVSGLSVALAAEIGALDTVGVHGIGFSAGGGSLFAVQCRSVWGGYWDQPARVPDADWAGRLRLLPVGGYDRQVWRLASPYGDNWSARWTTTLKAPAEGEYTFYYTSDDGARLWIDDKQIVNDWIPRSGLTSEAKAKLTAGDHAVRCEFFEQGGSAQAHLQWSGPGIERQVVPASVTSADGQPGWKSEYFLDLELKGEATVGHDEVIDFDWGEGGPAVFQAGPPIATLDWARLTDGVVIGQLRGPAKAYAGVMVGAAGAPSMGFQAWGEGLVALTRSPLGVGVPSFCLRALDDKAAYAVSNPADMPAAWAPGDQPLLFMAGFGSLPNLDAETAAARLQRAMGRGLNAVFPALEADGWAPLVNGKDLAGWRLRHADGLQSWAVEDGVLINREKGTDLVSDVPLTDCELHAEFLCPAGSNSGVYLQGRYEVQIADTYGQDLQPGVCGAIYGKAAPSKNACKPAGEWNSLDILFRGARPSLGGGLASHARATVVLNGEQIIDNAELDGITGGALDGDEWRAQGVLLQGDHGPIQYRNIRVRPLLGPGL